MYLPLFDIHLNVKTTIKIVNYRFLPSIITKLLAKYCGGMTILKRVCYYNHKLTANPVLYCTLLGDTRWRSLCSSRDNSNATSSAPRKFKHNTPP